MNLKYTCQSEWEFWGMRKGIFSGWDTPKCGVLLLCVLGPLLLNIRGVSGK